MKISGAFGGARRAVSELAGKAQAPRRRLPADLLLFAAAQTFLRAVDDPFEQAVRLLRIAGQPMIEGVAQGALDHARGLGARKPVLRLALELGLADKHREHGGRRAEHVLGGDLRHALVAGHLAIGTQGFSERRAQAGFVRAAVLRGDSVAIGAEKTVVVDPRDRPFDRAVTVGLVGPAGEDLLGDGLLAFDAVFEKVFQPAGEVEDGAFRCLAIARKLRLVAGPADLDAAEEIGLGTGHAEQPGRLEGCALAEDFRVGPETHLGAAPVLHRAKALQRPVRCPARVALPVELLTACHLDFEALRQCVRHRDADTVQPAARVVDFRVELAAGMQRGHYHFKRGLLLEFRMWVDRDAAPIVGDGQSAVSVELDLDAARVSRDRLVHGVVQHLGEEVMHRLLVGAADIHAGTPSHRLEPFQHLDVGSRIGLVALAAPASARLGLRGLGLPQRLARKLVLELGEEIARGGRALAFGGHTRRAGESVAGNCLLARTQLRLFQEFGRFRRSCRRRSW